MSDRVMVPGALPGLMREATELETLLTSQVADLTRRLAEAERERDLLKAVIQEAEGRSPPSGSAVSLMVAAQRETDRFHLRCCAAERERDALRAEVERLTKERDKALERATFWHRERDILHGGHDDD